MIKEGFGHANSEPDVDAHVRDAAQRFAKLGAMVEDVSVPAHLLGFPVWAAIRGDAACVTLLEMNGAGIEHEGLYVTSLHRPRDGLARARRRFPRHVKIASIFSKYTLDRYGGHYLRQGAEHAPAVARRLRRRACDARPAVDADGADEGDADPAARTRRRRRSRGEAGKPTRNTCPFNVTGHPAISVPCGMEDGRPIGLMLVGRHYDEATIYRAAAAFERSGDWTTF